MLLLSVVWLLCYVDLLGGHVGCWFGCCFFVDGFIIYLFVEGGGKPKLLRLFR